MLRSSTLVWRGLRFHWRAYLGVCLGAAVAAAVLTGALAAGDSVRFSLRQMALLRLGRTEAALASGDRFCRAALAPALAADLGTEVAAVLQVRGIGIADGGAARVNNVQLLGVDASFWQLATAAAPLAELAEGEAVVNRQLAARLALRPGDTLLVRFEKPAALPRDAPLAADQEASTALRLKVKGIASDPDLGRFGLRVTQVTPLNVFVSRSWLCRQAGLNGDRANLLLAGRVAPRAGSGQSRPSTLTAAACQAALGRQWTLADAALELRGVPGQNQFALRSERIFLEAPVEKGALAAGHGAAGVLTYFVNRVTAGGHASPYAFVAGIALPPVPPDMADDEIILNQWLADDLQVIPGADVELEYLVLGDRHELSAKTHSFRVRSIVPLAGPAADPELMPQFPGMSDAASCRDWKPGIPIDLGRIRPKDEEYWAAHRGTPKAFITLRTAEALWRNRFGELTAVRYPADTNTASELAAGIRERLDPATLGFEFQPVREAALQASAQAVDFGQLFLGLSFFLVTAALLLTGLLFVFAIDSRSEEIGALLALGFTPGQVRRLFLAEGFWVTVLGSLTGAPAGVAYNMLLIRGLNGLWQGAVGTSELQAHVEPLTLAVGAGAGLVVSVLAIWLAGRRQAKRTVQELYGGGDSARSSVQPAQGGWQLGVAVACLAGVAAIMAFTGTGRGREAVAAFFGAGALLLIGGIAGCSFGLTRLGRVRKGRRFRTAGLGMRNCVRRPRRSLAAIGLLACGVFLVLAVAANRHDPAGDASRPESGTGGFAFFGETALPLLYDLNSKAGRKAFGLGDVLPAGVRFVQLRVQDGDDASCLNLNRAQQPRLIGVDPEEFARRHAFTFAQALSPADAGSTWTLLDGDPAAEVIPAIADQTVIEWGLGKAIGDTLTYTDEAGRRFKVRLVAGLANSILQGNILISEKAFLRHFPSTSGSRMLLVDAPPAEMHALAPVLSRALADVGLELTPAARRLAEFSAVENTYLSVFLILGGLGVMLGSVGLGVLLLRNVLERRGELALLRAVGFSRRGICALLLGEHMLLLAAGLACGIIAALVAVLPALLSPGGAVPWLSLTGILAAVALNGAFWTVLAVTFATRGDLLPALRRE